MENISLVYSPATLADFIGALAALRGQPATVTVKPLSVAPTPPEIVPSVTVAEDTHGPLEQAYLKRAKLQRMRMTAEEKAHWNGDREALAEWRLLQLDEAEESEESNVKVPVLPSAADIEDLH